MKSSTSSMNCTKLSRDGFLKIDDFTIASLMRLKVIPVNSGMYLSSDMGHQKVILSATGEPLEDVVWQSDLPDVVRAAPLT
jgi:hypothetical protein